MSKQRINLTDMGPATDWRDAAAGKCRFRVIWDCQRCKAECRTMLTGKRQDIEELIRGGYCPNCKP